MPIRRLCLGLLCSAALVTAGCGEKASGIGAGHAKTAPAKTTAKPSAPATAANTSAQAAGRKKPAITVPKGPAPKTLVIKDLIKGTGAPVKAGDQIAVNYEGVAYSNGKAFDNSFDRGQPFPFRLGTGQVIPGWDQGLAGARVGARRELIIPANLAYGPQGSPPKIAPNEPLVFVIDILAKR